jgi:hypothetical protein
MKSISGLVGYYATEDGKIYSDRTGTLVELSPHLHKGYLHVNVRIGVGRSTRKTVPVHQLVLKAFVGNKPFENAVTRHLNGDALDNRVNNLCWGTQKENAQDEMKHGTAWFLKSPLSHHRKLNYEQVLDIKSKIENGISDSEIAESIGLSKEAIKQIRLGYNWAWVF